MMYIHTYIHRHACIHTYIVTWQREAVGDDDGDRARADNLTQPLGISLVAMR